MSIGRELRDPWGWLVAAVVGGVAWAAALPVAAAAGVGVGVLGTKVLVGLARGEPRPAGRQPAATADTLPVPHPHSPAGLLLARAEDAVSRLRHLAATPGDPWLRAQVSDVDDEAATALDALRQIGGRVTLVEGSISAGDQRRLTESRSRLTHAMQSTTDPRLRAEQQRGVAAINQQLEISARLDTLRQTLLARMENAVLGLEGLAARMGEVVALGPTAVDHDRAGDLVDSLAVELESLRGGLAEARALADRDPTGD